MARCALYAQPPFESSRAPISDLQSKVDVSMTILENGIKWLEPAPGNDTYAIAASEETSRELGVETVSDLGWLIEERPGEVTLCFNNDDDLRTRFDGLRGLERAYGIEFPEQNLIEVSLDAVYKAAEEGEICNFGVVFTTSGFIRELDLGLSSRTTKTSSPPITRRSQYDRRRSSSTRNSGRYSPPSPRGSIRRRCGG